MAQNQGNGPINPNNPNQNPQQLSKAYRDLLDVAQKLGKTNLLVGLDDTIDNVSKIKDLLADWKHELALIDDGASDFYDLVTSVNNELTKGKTALDMSKKAYASYTSVAEKMLNHRKGISVLDAEEIRKLKEKLDITTESMDQSNKLAQEELNSLITQRNLTTAENNRKMALEQILETNDLILSNMRDQIIESEKSLKVAENIENAYGLAGSSIDGLGKMIREIGGTKIHASLGLDDAKAAMAEKAKKVTNYGENKAGFWGQMQVFGTGLTEVFSSLLKSIPQLVAAFAAFKIIGAIVDLFKGMDESAGKFAKSMNMTYQDAAKTQANLAEVSASYKGLGVSTDKLMNNLSEISSQYGVVGDLTNEQLITATKLQTISGLSMEDQKGALALSIQNKQTLGIVTGQIMAQADISSRKLGVAINEKEVLKEVGKVSAATTLSLGKNPKLIADAVATTKALGMEMSQIEGIMDKMLDFESSIENELSAELLVGKNINLETARWAALNNDVAGAAKAISEQIGGSAEFTKMNRIQQDAFAKSVGMSREELAKTMFVQDQIKGLSGEVAKNREKAYNKLVDEHGIEKAQDALAQGKLDVLEKQMSMSEQLGAMFDKLKEVLAPLVANIMPHLASYLQAVSEKIADGSGILGALWSADSDKYLDEYKGFGDEFKNLANTPTYTRVQRTEDGIAPSSRGPFTVTDKYGATAVTAQGDNMVVSPNISRSNQTPQTQQILQQQSNIDMSETNRLLSALLRKQGNVQIDSTKMGTAIGMNTYRIQ